MQGVSFTWSNCNAAPDIRKRYIRVGRLLRRPELPEKLSENFEEIGVADSQGEGSLPVGKMDRFDPEIRGVENQFLSPKVNNC